MELGAIVGWVAAAMVTLLCVAARARRECLNAQTASLRDQGEYGYRAVHQSAA